MDFLQQYLSGNGLSQLSTTDKWIVAMVVVAVCVAGFFLLNKVVFPILKRFTQRTAVTWDDHLLSARVIKHASYLLPVLLAYVYVPMLFSDNPFTLSIVDKAFMLLILVITINLICAFISTFHVISSESESLRNRPLKGIYQMIKIVVVCIGVILGVSILFNKEPGVILTGIGASAAVLMLVFQDTIMSLVAGVQINAYDILRPGDWIVMEKNGANGIVTEVTLNFVKVRNWDNTTITIPTYSLVRDSFQNWRGMWDENGRRMNEKVFVDISTIRTCTPEMASQYAAMVGDNCPPQPQEVTNLWFYRYYMEELIRRHPLTNPNPHLMVRQQPVGAYGLPVEIYCFTTCTAWMSFEHYKAEIVETAYASLQQFGLKAYQAPSGADINNLKH